MKRFLSLLMIVFLLCSCNTVNTAKRNSDTVVDTGVWITYNEINNMLSAPSGFENEVALIAENCKNMKIKNVYIHVRSHCDSLFESDYFPLVKTVREKGFDTFEILLEAFHKVGIAVHAWINPYRVSTSTNDVNSLDVNSPAYKWLNDDNSENDINICYSNGIYLNPASAQVQKLVIDGIKEIIEKYDVDGIHFDDYFYPTVDTAFDEISYNKYCEATEKPLALADWRRANVNALISGCYSAIKSENEDIIFSVSPAASIDKNYNELFADVRLWVKNGYIDCIIPQLYFGFDYPQSEYKFENLLNNWKKVAELNSDVSMFLGLAGYKIGTDSLYDKEEWQTKDDIIAKQAEVCYTDALINGYVIFSYSSLFSSVELNTRQRENLFKIMEKYELLNEESL